jgi:serine phosphatase RsbU (regulator of sigma subunit)
MASLVIREGPGAGAGNEYPLAPERTLIGRDVEVDIQLASKTVSRQHCQILSADGSYYIEDLGSRNGTYLNGRRVVRRMALSPRDLLKIGEFSFELSLPGAPNLRETDLVVREQVEATPSNESLYSLNPAQKLRIVLEIAQELCTYLDLQILLNSLLRHLLRLFPKADRGLILLGDQDRLMVRAHRSRRGDVDFPFSRTIVNKSLEEGVGILSEDVRQDQRFTDSQSLHDLPVSSVLCVPLICKDGRRLGVIQLDRSTLDDPFRGEELRLLATVGLQAAVVLENAALQAERVYEEVIHKELAMAREIQHAFLPSPFAAQAVHGFELVGQVVPAREVSGDYYDFFMLGDGRVGFFVGDVSGKGVPAALFLVAVRTLGRHLAAAAMAPAETLAHLNDALAADNPSSMFITVAYGIYDPQSGEVLLASAGHPAPLLRRGDGRVEEACVPSGGLLGCMVGNIGLTDTSLLLNPGETLIYFTNGITKALAPDGQSTFGVSGLMAALAGPCRHLSLKDSIESARTAVQKFACRADPDDDQTFLMLRRA